MSGKHKKHKKQLGVNFSISMPAEDLQLLDALAEQQDIKRSKLIQQLIAKERQKYSEGVKKILAPISA